MQRSLLLFENSIKTEATRKIYLCFLDKFKDFYRLDAYDSIIVLGEPQLQIMVEDYVMMLKRNWRKFHEDVYGWDSGLFGNQ